VGSGCALVVIVPEYLSIVCELSTEEMSLHIISPRTIPSRLSMVARAYGYSSESTVLYYFAMRHNGGSDRASRDLLGI